MDLRPALGSQALTNGEIILFIVYVTFEHIHFLIVIAIYIVHFATTPRRLFYVTIFPSAHCNQYPYKHSITLVNVCIYRIKCFEYAKMIGNN